MATGLQRPGPRRGRTRRAAADGTGPAWCYASATGRPVELRPRPPERTVASLSGGERNAAGAAAPRRPGIAGPFRRPKPRRKPACGGTRPRWAGCRGPGELKVAMARGILQAAPIELALNQGRVHLAPRIAVSPRARRVQPARRTAGRASPSRSGHAAPWCCATPRRHGQRHRPPRNDFHRARLLPHSVGRSGRRRRLRPAGNSLAGNGIGADAPRVSSAVRRRLPRSVAAGIGRGLPPEGPPRLSRRPGTGVSPADGPHQRLGRIRPDDGSDGRAAGAAAVAGQQCGRHPGGRQPNDPPPAARHA